MPWSPAGAWVALRLSFPKLGPVRCAQRASSRSVQLKELQNEHTSDAVGAGGPNICTERDCSSCPRSVQGGTQNQSRYDGEDNHRFHGYASAARSSSESFTAARTGHYSARTF